MKSQLVTTGIVLARTDYGEADRILTIMTADHGKVRVMAKGVRRARSRLAGGIELFSVSELTLLPARGQLQTLVSSRLVSHYGNIVKDIRRTMLGYELLKRINRVTEDAADKEFMELLRQGLEGLDDLVLSIELLEFWFNMKLLSVTGHTPRLLEDAAGLPLAVERRYVFDFDEMAFRSRDGAPFGASHIKLLRLAHAAQSAAVLKQIKDAGEYVADALQLSSNMVKMNLRV